MNEDDMWSPKDKEKVVPIQQRPLYNNRLASLEETGNVIERLIAKRKLVYSFGGLPAVIRTEPSEVFKDPDEPEKPLMTRRITLAKPNHLVGPCETVADFETAAAKNPQPCAPPDRLLKYLADNMGSKLPPVAQFVGHPVLMPNGQIITGAHGYDADTSLYIDCEKMQLPIPSTTKEAEDILRDWLVDFPFDTDEDFWRAVALPITIMTAPVNTISAQGPPAWLFDARERGTGKSTLAELLISVVTNQSVPARVWSQEIEEQRKVLFTLSKESHPAVMFDNISRGHTIRGDAPEGYISATSIGDRLLGMSKEASFRANTILTWSGNEVKLSEDLFSRTLGVRLVWRGNGVASNRQFTHPNIRKYTRDNRARIIGALAKVAMTAGESENIGRFPEWYESAARGITVYAGASWLDPWTDDQPITDRVFSIAGRTLMEAMWKKRLIIAQLYGEPEEDNGIIWFTAADLRQHCGVELNAYLSEGNTKQRHPEADFNPNDVPNKTVSKRLRWLSGQKCAGLTFDAETRKLGGRTYHKPAIVFGLEGELVSGDGQAHL